MLRSFAILSGACKSGGTTVISSPFSRRPFVPSLRFGPLTKHCSTKSTEISTQAAPENKKEDGNNIDNWHTIYHFPSIMITASVKRLKYYPTVVTAVSVPVSIALAYANIWSMTTAEIVGAIGLTSTMTLSLFSMITNNLVGFVYCDETQSKVKISFLNAKGKREDCVYSVDDLVPRSELPSSLLKLYFPIKNHENSDVYKLVHRYGEIYDVQTFDKVFGRDVVMK
ncbi:transmembrane protein 186 [Anopheles aquasalis]|uniref:transmembrane protein 186 n=1 Tax=Anopheles aquasalis TaxID=42839 RepID=UPI00215ACF35|nr:transmembrane protein 186 [Anopheles aquasalis]